jgi:hypothetical protein
MALRAPAVRWGHQVSGARKVRRALSALRDQLAPTAQRDLRGLRARPARRVLRGLSARGGRLVLTARQDLRARPARRVRRALSAHGDQLAPMERRGPQVLKAPLALTARTETLCRP